MELRDYQKEPAKQLLKVFKSGSRAGLDASEMGIGKTYVAAWVAAQLKLPVFVLCPKIVVDPWKEVLAGMGCKKIAGVINYEKLIRSGCEHLEIEDGDIYTWTLPKNAIVIFDEAHKCRNPESKTTRLLLKAWARKDLKILIVSGTLADSPSDMYATGFVLGLHRLTNFDQFRIDHGCTEKYHYGDWVTDEFNDWRRRKKDRTTTIREFALARNMKHQYIDYLYNTGSGGMERIHEQLLPKKGIRLKKSEVPGFPDKIVDVISLTEEDTQPAVEEMSEQLAVLEKKTEEGSQEEKVLINRGRQEAELLKVPFLISETIEALESGCHVAIFVNFTETMDLLLEAFGTDCQISGRQSADERRECIRAFQANEEPIIVANTKAGGVGVSLHDLHGIPRRSFISPTFSAIDLLQGIDRIHRSGSQSGAHITLVFLSYGAEEKVCRTVQKKINNLDKLNDGDLQNPYRVEIRRTIKRVDSEASASNNEDVFGNFGLNF